MCWATPAQAHARSGHRIPIAAYLRNSDAFDRAIANFSTAYADQNERDHQALLDAVNSGRVSAQTGRQPWAAETETVEVTDSASVTSSQIRQPPKGRLSRSTSCALQRHIRGGAGCGPGEHDAGAVPAG